MTRTRRITAALATAAVVGLSLTACGGAPDDASAEDFCQTFAEQQSSDPEASPEDQVDQAHEGADALNEVGTPEDISDDEREGFEIFVDAASNVEEGDIEDVENAESEEDLFGAIGIDEDDIDDVRAFYAYAGETCAEELAGSVPSGGES